MKKTKRRHVIVANFIKFFRNCVYEVTITGFGCGKGSGGIDSD